MSTTMKGKVAIVTGASRGIGREIALRLADCGCDVVVAAKTVAPHPTLPGTIYTVVEEIRERGRRGLAIQVDVRDDEAVERMVKLTLEHFERIDILVCNSGALWWKSVRDTPMRRYDLVHGVNARGAFACVHAVLPVMLRQKFGRIIVMSPPIDLDILPGRVAYCISKFGMTMLAKGLAREVQGSGVAINALWPVTMVESYATKNFQLGSSSLWRRATIIADCVERMVQESPESLSGESLLDEDYLRSKGVTDFKQYRCNPDVEPPRAWPLKNESTFSAPDGAVLPPGTDRISKL